jgi:hypothetical protein
MYSKIALLIAVFLTVLLSVPVQSHSNLHGDVTGSTKNNKVLKIGKETALDIAKATRAVNAATKNNIPGALVRRDAAGNIITNMLTIEGTTTSPGHVATKAYVDSLLESEMAGLSSASNTFYVSKSGDDSNNGSLSTPFLTIKAAVSAANLLSTGASSVVINVGAGTFIEDNSTGPIMITADGICIIGTSINGTVIRPSTLTQDLFSVTVSAVQFHDLTVTAGVDGSTKSGITLTSDAAGTGRFESVAVQRFNVGISLTSSAGVPIMSFDHAQFRGNNTNIAINSIRALIKNSACLGPFSGAVPTNTGISIIGSTSLVTILSNSFRLMNTGILASGGASVRVLGTNFENSNNGINCTGGSVSTITGCNFVINNASTVNLLATGVGTFCTLTACNFSCKNSSGNPQGTAVAVTTGANLNIGGCAIEDAVIGLSCGAIGDSSSTMVIANAVTLVDNTNDITQLGASTLHFTAGIVNYAKISISDPTNVAFNAFDDIFTIGNGADNKQVIFQVFNGQPAMPIITYEPSYYGNKGLVYKNTDDPTITALQSQNDDACNYLITGDSSKKACINLISDTSISGTDSDVRGWSIAKLGTNANLDLNYSNNDTVGQAARGANSVMQLNGFDNQVEFPLAANTPLPTNDVAKLVWAGDTNLYRGAANTLQTDDDLIVGGLTANCALATNSSKQLVSSNTTSTELGYIAGVTSAVQTQVDSKLAKNGDTMTGNLTLPAGTSALPALNFSGHNTTGISAATPNTLSFDTSGVERLTIGDSNIVAMARLVLLNLFCNQATQSVIPTNGGSVAVNSGTSILILKHTSNIVGYTINFPPNPSDGQFFMIILGTSNKITSVTNATTDGASVVNGISSLVPSDILSIDGGASVSYFYNSTANTWYRCNRG